MEAGLQVVPKGLERAQRCVRREPLVGTVDVQDGEQLWQQRRQVALKLVRQRDAQLAQHVEGMHLHRPHTRG